LNVRAAALVLAALALHCSSAAAPDADAPIVVVTKSGPVRGEMLSETRAFRGIPYAAPPVGALRFTPPRDPAPWTEVRETTQLGASCTQLSIVGSLVTTSAEDCLTLNVWAPRIARTKAPVVVWLHGGAFIGGSSADPFYDGAKLAQRAGIVLVTVNYRLGPFGFLAHEAMGPGTANLGLQDQRAALSWVQANIDAFGGDPGNVTIAGESAGGISVGLHMLMPSSRGLFHRAVSQSGVASAFTLQTKAEARAMADELAKRVDCAPPKELAPCLRAVDKLVLLEALKKKDAGGGGLLFGAPPQPLWFPTIDEIEIGAQPAQLVAEGKLARVPYLAGTNAEEGALFHAGFFGDKPLKTEADYLNALNGTFGADAARVAEAYPLASFAGPDAALARIETDLAFVGPTRAAARAHASAGAPTFVYELRAPIGGGLLSTVGPAHSIDLFFLFGNDVRPIGTLADDQQELSHAFARYWGAHAKNGAPAAAGLPAWPAYDADTERHLVLDRTITTSAALRKDVCERLRGVSMNPPRF
jgi:para-nitrobenzyl esterase